MAEKIKGNCIMAQSGGPTAVINSSILGVIEEAMKHSVIEGIYGALNGVLGILNEDLIDLRRESRGTLKGLKNTPSSALGSCRYKLKEEDYVKILKVFKTYNIRYFFYNGGNDSMDTANRISKLAQEQNYDMRVIGVPKTIDNDLVITDHCPGYGSVLRSNAIAIRDAGYDTDAIYQPDRIKIYECMGRNTGWIAAGSALARENSDDAPHLIYCPEVPLSLDKFLGDVQKVYDRLGRVFIAVSEGLVSEDKQPISASASSVDKDSFGHVQYGGVADFLSEMIKKKLDIKTRFDKPGTVQRVAADRVSVVDREEAYEAGKSAVKEAVSGKSDYMVTLVREKGEKYRCSPGLAKLDEVANRIKLVPREFLNSEGNDVSEEFLSYAQPLLGGALPPYVRLEKHHLPKKS